MNLTGEIMWVVTARGQMTLPELPDHLEAEGFEGEGETAIQLQEPGTPFMWTGLSRELSNALVEAFDDELVRWVPCPEVAYDQRPELADDDEWLPCLLVPRNYKPGDATPRVGVHHPSRPRRWAGDV